MKVKALIPFTLRDSSTGELTSIACGAIAEVSSELGVCCSNSQCWNTHSDI